MSFPRSYQIKNYKGKIYATVLPNKELGIDKVVLNTMVIDNTNKWMSLQDVNYKINSMLQTMPNSELLRLIVHFEKVPKSQGLGLKVKKGSYGAFGKVETVIGMHSNCSLYVDRSRSGDTLGNSS